jgi:hypothetical protein
VGADFPERGNRRANCRELFGPVEEERSCVHGLPTCGLVGLRQVWYQSLILFFIFQERKSRRNFNHAAEEKGQTNTRSTRG